MGRPGQQSETLWECRILEAAGKLEDLVQSFPEEGTIQGY